MQTAPQNAAILHGRCFIPHICNLARHYIAEMIFSPIPLYKQLKNQPHLSQDLIKWQENWQACDQLQMNGSALEKEALNEISEVNSTLSKHGRYLAAEIEKENGIPTYYIYTVSEAIL